MKISVIITSLNSAKYIAKAIESFLDQNYDQKELIIVDGLSSDGSHQIIEKYHEQYPEFIRWIKDKDTGISNARNIALKYVSGDLIGFLGSDDILHRDFFYQASYYFNLCKNFDVIYFNNYCLGNSFSFNNSASISVNYRNLIKYCPIGSGESFYYKKTIFDNFKFNENNKLTMDYELNLAIASSKKKDQSKYLFFPVNIPCVFNFDTGANISSKNSISQRIETIVVQIKYSDSLFKKIKIYLRSLKLIIKQYNIFKNFKNI